MDKPLTELGFSCPQCRNPLTDYAIACAGCGMDVRRNDPRSADVLARSINRREQSIFFYVSPLKLVVMSTVTFNFYQLFWFYKNWCYVQEHTHRKILPLARAIFWPIFYFSLSKEICRAGTVQGVSCKYSPFVIAGVYFALSACGQLHGWLSLIGLLAPLALIPVQRYVNSLNSGNPTPINSRFTIVNWIGIVIGAGLLVLNII